MVRIRRLADGWIEIRLIDDGGELEGVMRLRPTYHALFLAHLLAAQDQVRELEDGPPLGGLVLPFPTRPADLLSPQ